MSRGSAQRTDAFGFSLSWVLGKTPAASSRPFKGAVARRIAPAFTSIERTGSDLARKIWELRKHQLLGAHAFPLLVKLVLARDGLYTVTDEDRDAIDDFEPLANCRPFERSGQGRNAVFEWQRVRQECRSERLRAWAEERFLELAKEEGDPPTY